MPITFLLAAMITTAPEAVKWTPTGPGLSMSVLSGDPKAEGSPFVIRLKLDDGVRIAPHWHPTDEHLTIVSGTFYMGMGDTMDEKQATPMVQGTYSLMPKEMHHYGFAKSETVV